MHDTMAHLSNVTWQAELDPQSVNFANKSNTLCHSNLLLLSCGHIREKLTAAACGNCCKTANSLQISR